MRILFTTIPLPGHFFPLVPLGWACAAVGHDVLVASTDGFLPTVLRSGLPGASCGPGTGFVDLATDGSASGGFEELRFTNGRMFGRIATGNLPGMTRLVDSWRPDLVVSERAEFAGPVAALAHRIPHCELHWGAAPLAEYRAAAAVELRSRLAALGVTDLPRPALSINPWPPSLRLDYATFHQSIRHVPYNGEARVPDWLLAPRRRPRVCLTLGTVVPRQGRGRVAETVLGILARLTELDIEVVVAVDDRIAAGWPALPEGVAHVGRMPLSPVFAGCDAAIHHGGQGTALAALEAGLPQLVLPVFDDQFDNADAVVRAGVGMRLTPDQVSPDAVARNCAELLDLPRYRSSAARVAEEIHAQPSPVRIVDRLVDVATGRDTRGRAA